MSVKSARKDIRVFTFWLKRHHPRWVDDVHAHHHGNVVDGCPYAIEYIEAESIQWKPLSSPVKQERALSRQKRSGWKRQLKVPFNTTLHWLFGSRGWRKVCKVTLRKSWYHSTDKCIYIHSVRSKTNKYVYVPTYIVAWLCTSMLQTFIGVAVRFKDKS